MGTLTRFKPHLETIRSDLSFSCTEKRKLSANSPKREKQSLKNCHSVSLLSVYGKVLEKLISHEIIGLFLWKRSYNTKLILHKINTASDLGLFY